MGGQSSWCCLPLLDARASETTTEAKDNRCYDVRVPKRLPIIDGRPPPKMFTGPGGQDGYTVMQVLTSLAPAQFPSHWSAKQAVKRGFILLRGTPIKTDAIVVDGDVLSVRSMQQRAADICTTASCTRMIDKHMVVPGTPSVIFEDYDFAVVNKPAGMPMHGGHGVSEANSLRATLPLLLRKEQGHDALPRPEPVHRLDRATSGLVVCAKTSKAMSALTQCFAERSITKTYQAIVRGLVEGEGTVDAPVGGKPAVSVWRALRSTWLPQLSDYITELELQPVTGRKHQLRLHCQRVLRCPILGDAQYGGGGACGSRATAANICSGLLLAAVRIELMHPVHGERVSIQADPPDEFNLLMQTLLHTSSAAH